MRAAGAVAALVLLCLSSLSASAEERILRFASAIEIQPDASLIVSETITVQVEGRAIKRGIYRDFPTRYRDRYGNRVRVGFEVLDVRRDGAPETWQQSALSNGVRVRIGRADRFLENGLHTYVLTYRTTRQIGFFDDFDELYWNVTGTDWAFPIDTAEALIRLPGEAPVLNVTAYTGRPGEQGTDWRAERDGTAVRFAATRPLAPGEGLTVVVSWPKGFVTAPSSANRLNWFIRDNAVTGVIFAGVLAVLTYYLLAWYHFGRDPAPGTIIPRFKPPKNLSPAAARFITHMGFDQTAYAAALINMAVKGYLLIEEDERDEAPFRLRRREGADPLSLSTGERRLAKALFKSGPSVALKNTNHRVVGKSLKALKATLRNEFEQGYFIRNTRLFLIGFGLTVATLIAATLISDAAPQTFISGIFLLVLSAIATYLVLRFVGARLAVAVPSLSMLAGTLGSGRVNLVAVILFMIITGFNVVALSLLNLSGGLGQILGFATLGGVNVLFFFLLKAPTLAGRALMDEIDGFRHYLSVAEKDRLNVLNPPEKTPELFERYLPYALALGVENEWSEQFADMLAAATTTPDGRGTSYQPHWYRGRAWHNGHMRDFSSALGSGLTKAVAASASPPGSHSGGGGFSGGGGGGGGGGGW